METEFTPFELKEREKRRCSANPNLQPGAKLLFCWLADNSHMRMFGGSDGTQICVSLLQLSEHLASSRASIARWVSEIVDSGFVKVSKRKIYRCSHPFNVYKIACLCPEKGSAESELWGKNAESQIETQGKTPQNEGEVSYLGRPSLKLRPGKSQIEAGPDSNLVRASLKLSPGPPQIESGPDSNLVPPGLKLRRPRTQIETPPYSNLDLPGPNLRLKGRIRSTGEQETSKAVQRVSSSPAQRLREREWLVQLGEMVGAKEMSNWGGRWRNRYREDSEKAGRVVAELRRMVKEKEIKSNAGAAADSLWQHFASHRAMKPSPRL